MKHFIAKGLSALVAACSLFSLAAPAAVLQSTQVGATAGAFDTAITVNLLQAGQQSLGSVTASHGPSVPTSFTAAGLNDGSAAADGNLTYYGVADSTGGNLPVALTFSLNTNSATGGSTTGYTLSRMQIIAGWTSANLGDHSFQLLLSLNGGPFNNYGTFGATTTLNGGNNAILDTLSGGSGPLAQGVTGIQLVFTNPGGTGGTLLREIQAFGAPTTNSPPVPYRLAAVGDSITAGYTDNPNWTVPFNFGYRSGLLTRLTTNGFPFQYVGESPEPWSGTDGAVTNIPAVDLRILGQDHCDGYAGMGTAFVAGNIGAWLAVDQPDILLLMIGINDIPEGSSAAPRAAELNLSNIVATVVNSRPNTRLIVAQITPYSSFTPAIVAYNSYIAGTLVPYFADQGKFVSTVNQYTNMCLPGTTNINPALYANGINHPVPAAYDALSQTWFAGIQALTLPPAPVSAVNANLVINGGFEVPIVPANSHTITPSGAGWTFTSDVAGAGSGIDQGLAYGAGGSNSFDGVQRACLQSSGDGSVTHLSQAVAGFAVGQYYQLSFRAEAIAAFSGANPFHVSLINGTSTNRLFGGSDLVPATSGYTLYTSAPFPASNTVMTLDFADDGLDVVTHVSWIDAVAIVPVAGENLIVNGGFEVPDFPGTSHTIAPVTPAWTFTPGVSGAGSGIDRNDPYGSSGSIAFEGAQQACLQSSGNGSVTSISQVISNFTAGRSYQLSFLSKAIGTFSGANPFHAVVFDRTSTNQLFGGQDVVPGTAGYTLYTSAPFTADGPVMTLAFADHGLSDVTHVSWIDKVSIQALPVSISGLTNIAGQPQIQFIGDTNLSYTVLGAADLTMPLSDWTVLGPAVPRVSNSFSFTDVTATNDAQRFYNVRLP